MSEENLKPEEIEDQTLSPEENKEISEALASIKKKIKEKDRVK